LWWNASHGFASYRHTGDNADLAGSLFHPAAFADFLFSQFAVFGPIFAGALLWLVLRPRDMAEPRARLLAAFAFPSLAMMLAIGLISRAEPNWAAPAYISATILVIAFLVRAGRGRLAAVSIALNLVATATMFGGRDALAAAGLALPAKYDPLHRLRGWRALGTAVGAALRDHPGLMLLADDRETLAALIYYVEPHPLDATKWSVLHRIKDQWDLTNDLANYPGRRFLLVSEHELIPEMRPSFAAIEKLQSLTIPLGPGAARHYTLYLARDFQGYRY
jgi:hypothetical protein